MMIIISELIHIRATTDCRFISSVHF